MIVNLKKDDFENEIEKYEGIVLVDFWASWCGPCKRFADILHVLDKEMCQDLKICKVNIDEEAELAEKFNIVSIPTVMIYKNGKLVEHFLGGKSLGELKNLINNLK